VKKTAARFSKDFHVVLANRRGEAAEMVIAPGDAEGGSDNRHRGADQWLFVVSGTGRAIVNERSHRLQQRSLLLIEQGERHEIRNTGTDPLVTLNFYAPAAYSRSDDPLPRGRR